MDSIQQAIRLYKGKGHEIEGVEFKDDKSGQNRVVKERARAVIQTIPYKKILKKMRIALIQYVVFFYNSVNTYAAYKD